MAHEGYHRVEVPTTIVEQDAQYYMARIEGQLARLDLLTNGYYWHEHEEFISAIKETKGFLASLRSALSPHRIDVA